jgi:ParB-like nuclease domain
MKGAAKTRPSAAKKQHVRKSELLARYRVELVAVEDIKPSPENEEIYGVIDFESDPLLQTLVDSIDRLGLEEPIICTADGYILSGHRRVTAVKHLGWREVPVRFSRIRREDSTDYHRLLAQYNPQRMKSVAALLSEQFLKSDSYVSNDDFTTYEYSKTDVEAEFITVKGNKFIDPIGDRQTEFLEATVRVINDLRPFWPLTVRQVHYKLLNNPPLTQTTKDRSERWRYYELQA